MQQASALRGRGQEGDRGYEAKDRITSEWSDVWRDEMQREDETGGTVAYCE